MSALTDLETPRAIELLPRIGHDPSDAATRVLSSTRRRGQPDTASDAPLVEQDEVPEGGQGWAVVIGCSVVLWWAVGTNYSWGIIQAALIDNGLAATSSVAFVGSLTTACIAFFAIANARIARAIGTRKTSLLGVFFIGLGEILASFSTQNLGGLFVTAGCISGFGASLCFLVATVIPAQYFKTKRGMANGLVYMGGGVGGAVNSFLMTALIDNLKIEWAYRILGFLTLATGLPGAWFVQERRPLGSNAIVEWHLFKDLRFVLIFLAGGLTTFTIFVPPFFLPLYTSRLGFSSTATAGFLAAYNIASAAGRFLCGFACDRLGSINTLFISMLVNSLSILVLWLEASSLGPLTAFAIVNGLANGGFFSSMPTVIGNSFNPSVVGTALAMLITSYGGGYLFGAPIAGYLLTAAGGSDAPIDAYRPAIYYAGFIALGSAFLVAMARVRTSRKLLNRC